MLRRSLHRLHDPLFIHLNNNVKKYSDTIINPSDIDFNNPNITKKSWFSNLVFPYEFPNNNNQVNLTDSETTFPTHKTVKVKIYPTNEQRDILNYWFNSFNIMYNETILFLRKHVPYGNFKFYKQYSGQYRRYCFNIKDIKNIDKDITKLENQRQANLNKLNALFLIEKKSKNIREKINDCRESIHNINDKIKDKNSNKDEILKENKALFKYKSLYLSLKSHIDTFLNDQHIRTNYLKSKRDEIANNFSYKDDETKKIHSHSLDGAIKRACANYKTCMDNFLNNRIRRFRIRCRNLKKSNKIVEIDTTSFNLDKTDGYYYICKKMLGKLKLEYNGKEYKIDKPSVSSIFFDGISFTLQIPKPIINSNIPAKSPFIALDGGVRDFLTGFTNNSVIKFGHNLTPIISKYYDKIDKLNSFNVFQKSNIDDLVHKERGNFINLMTKNIKNNNKYYGQIIDAHGKLTFLEQIKKQKSLIECEIERCGNIIVRNKNLIKKIFGKELNKHYVKRTNKLEKSIEFNENRKTKLEKIKVNDKIRNKYEKYLWYLKNRKIDYYNSKIKYKINELHWQTASELAKNYEIIILGKINTSQILKSSNLGPKTKRILQSLSHYNFRQKLVYKSLTYDRKIIVADEKYTTKTCPICANYNEYVRDEKTIICKGCKFSYDRDGGASQCIYMSALE